MSKLSLVDEVFATEKIWLPDADADERERAVLALRHAVQYGQIDGDHHKAWVIDRIVRALTGDAYDAFIERWDDEEEFAWDTGVAP